MDEKPPMKTAVSLTRSGLPRIIPVELRKVIRQRKDPRVVKFVLTFCGLHKLLAVWGRGPRVKSTTIHIPKYHPSQACVDIMSELMTRIQPMLNAYTYSRYQSIPMHLG